MSKESSTKQWESDPNLHKRNAVMGEVIFDDKPVAGATVTVVQTGQSHPISDVGTYILVLDPDELATDTHELLFRAPGFQDERRTVTIPKNKRVRVDVELKPAK